VGTSATDPSKEEFAEVAAADVASGHFDGLWFGPTGEFMAAIEGTTIHWDEGPPKDLKLHSAVAVSTDMFGQVFSATLDSQGRLRWDDGDLWTRHSSAEAAAEAIAKAVPADAKSEDT